MRTCWKVKGLGVGVHPFVPTPNMVISTVYYRDVETKQFFIDEKSKVLGTFLVTSFGVDKKSIRVAIVQRIMGVTLHEYHTGVPIRNSVLGIVTDDLSIITPLYLRGIMRHVDPKDYYNTKSKCEHDGVKLPVNNR